MKLFLLVLTTGLTALNVRGANTAATGPLVLIDTAKPSFHTPLYSSSFAMGEAEHAKTVLAFWRNWDKNELDKSFPLLADTVEFILPDGTRLYGDKKTVWNEVKAYRGSFTEMKSEVDACLPVKTAGKGHQWVAIWGREHHTTADGKKESVDLHEVWRFNKAGRVMGMSQYGAGVNAEARRLR